MHTLRCSRASVLFGDFYGAEEGTRTPTPLRVHGPEPCASANSATSASDFRSKATLTGPLVGRTTFLFYRCSLACQTCGINSTEPSGKNLWRTRWDVEAREQRYNRSSNFFRESL